MDAEEMTESSAPLVLVSGHSHVFRGARLAVAASPPPSVLRPAAVIVSFTDGVEVDGELVAGPNPDELGLSVPAYRTMAGHSIPEAIWPVTVSAGDQGQLVVKLGQRLS